MNTVVTQASGANQAHLRAHEAVVDARHLRGQRFLRRGARVDLLHGHVRHRPDKLGTSRHAISEKTSPGQVFSDKYM